METQKTTSGGVATAGLEELKRIFSESAPPGAERFLSLWNNTRQTFSDALAYRDKGDEASFRSLLGHMDGFIRAGIGAAFGVNLSDGSGKIDELRDAVVRISGSNGSAPEALIAGRLLNAAILIERYASVANIQGGAKPVASIAPLPPPPLPSPHSTGFMTEAEIHRYNAGYFGGDALREEYEKALAAAMDRLVHASVPAALENLVSKIGGIWQYGAGSLEQLRLFVDGMVTNQNIMKTLESNAKEFAGALVGASKAINALTAYIGKQKSAKPVNHR